MDGLQWKTLLKIDDFEVPLFLETPMSISRVYLVYPKPQEIRCDPLLGPCRNFKKRLSQKKQLALNNSH